jgi:hypothetical protein
VFNFYTSGGQQFSPEFESLLHHNHNQIKKFLPPLAMP